MLMLTFTLGGDRYVVNCESVKKILPLVNFERVKNFPLSVVGLMNYGGTAVPVIDLTTVLYETANAKLWNTRILLCKKKDDKLIGFIVDGLTRTEDYNPTAFKKTGLSVGKFPFLGGMMSDAEGMIQEIEVPALMDYVESQLLAEA